MSTADSFAEHVRLEAQAVYLSAMMDTTSSTPTEDSSGIRELDIGCGTGIITDQMAEAFPQAECIGLGLFKVPDRRPHGRSEANRSQRSR